MSEIGWVYADLRKNRQKLLLVSSSRIIQARFKLQASSFDFSNSFFSLLIPIATRFTIQNNICIKYQDSLIPFHSQHEFQFRNFKFPLWSESILVSLIEGSESEVLTFQARWTFGFTNGAAEGVEVEDVEVEMLELAILELVLVLMELVLAVVWEVLIVVAVTVSVTVAVTVVATLIVAVTVWAEHVEAALAIFKTCQPNIKSNDQARLARLRNINI